MVGDTIKVLHSVPNHVDSPEKRAKWLFLGISRAQNSFLFVFKIETGLIK